MHWFWRGLIAIVVGGVIRIPMGIILAVTYTLLRGNNDAIQFASMVVFGIEMATVLAVYAWLTRRYAPPARDGETHCRQCNYILRGLTEPRCPECGEKI